MLGKITLEPPFTVWTLLCSLEYLDEKEGPKIKQFLEI